MSKTTDTLMFNHGFAVARPGRLARLTAMELLDPIREDGSEGTLIQFPYEGLCDLVATLIANIEEQDREIDTLKDLLRAPR